MIRHRRELQPPHKASAGSHGHSHGWSNYFIRQHHRDEATGDVARRCARGATGQKASDRSGRRTIEGRTADA
jgi:hypothetical protein